MKCRTTTTTSDTIADLTARARCRIIDPINVSDLTLVSLIIVLQIWIEITTFAIRALLMLRQPQLVKKLKSLNILKR